MSDYFVYILMCWNSPEERDNKPFLYTGYTHDLDQRIRLHRKGLTRTTKRYSHMKHVYIEKCKTEKEAQRREKFIKRQSRAWKLALIKKYRKSE